MAFTGLGLLHDVALLIGLGRERRQSGPSAEDPDGFASTVDHMELAGHDPVGRFILGERQLRHRDTRQRASEKAEQRSENEQAEVNSFGPGKPSLVDNNVRPAELVTPHSLEPAIEPLGHLPFHFGSIRMAGVVVEDALEFAARAAATRPLLQSASRR